MTERLYYTDAYLRDFEARVAERADDGRRIYLDRTGFYPTSGGQPFDTGQLGGSRVVDVVDEGERIAHVLDSPSDAAEGAAVRGAVDWARRFDHMQQHTGQHLLSAVLEDLFGFATASVHFGEGASTIDIEADGLSPARAVQAERRANELVWAALPVTVAFEEASTAQGLRKASARSGTIRIVSIEGVDRSACGGTHVRSTAEIGPVLVRRVERAKQLVRVEFLCGRRALERARRDDDALARAAHALSASMEEVPGLVEAQAVRTREAESRATKLAEELAAYRGRELYDRTAPGGDGVRRHVERLADGTALETVRALALAFASQPRAVFVAAGTRPAAVLVAASEDSGVNAGALLKAALAEHGGRGGGSQRLAQGSVPDAAAVNAVLARVTGERAA